MDVKADQLARVYVKIREARALAAQDYETMDEELKGQQQLIKEQLLEICKEAGADSLKTEYGTISRVIKERYWTNDWTEMYKVITENNVPELLEKRIAQNNIKEWVKENPDKFPKGMNVDREYDIRVTKPRK